MLRHPWPAGAPAVSFAVERLRWSVLSSRTDDQQGLPAVDTGEARLGHTQMRVRRRPGVLTAPFNRSP